MELVYLDLPLDLLLHIGKVLEQQGDPTFVSFSFSCKALYTLLTSTWLTPDAVRNKRKFCQLCAERGYKGLMKWGRKQHCPWNFEVCLLASSCPNLFPLLRWAVSHGAPLSDACCLQAARGGCLKTLRWLYKRGCNWKSDIAREAAIMGHTHVLQWMREKDLLTDFGKPKRNKSGYLPNDRPPDKISTPVNGDLGTLKWLQENQCFVTVSVYNAARLGHSHVLRWLAAETEVPFRIDWQSGLKPAARAGNVEFLRSLRSSRFFSGTWNTDIFASAAKSGNLEVLQQLMDLGLPYDHKAPKYAAKYGHLHALRWLTDCCPLTIDCFIAAAKKGNIEVLEYLLSRNCPWSTQVASTAARYGHLEALNWLSENGCPWDDLVYWNAVSGGTKNIIPILKWAKSRNCETRDRDIFEAAARSPVLNLELITWLLDNNFPHDCNTCVAAAKVGNLNLLKFLIKRGFEWKRDITTFHAAAKNHLHVLVWLVENGCPFPNDDTIPQFATRFRNLEMLKWAQAHGCDLGGSLVACNIWERGNLPILKFFYKTASFSSFDLNKLAAACNWDCIKWAVEKKGAKMSAYLVAPGRL
eukprot:TRINITY_DN4757_c0_g1_i1.p1 TRINITY_DN4757_c0_g1~~TRINITY_DN4757_c0_g1_i1.p1  ORF type:complete len:583 (+),score=74.03 TRINITY_DN4757_c0_g1_i1:43-1791(+)